MASSTKKDATDPNAVASGAEAGRKYSNEFKKNVVRTSEEAKKKGSNGGKKSGEARRNKRDARDAILYMLNLAAKGKLESNLKELGFPTEELTNMAALQARLFTMAMAGDIEAYKTLMKMAGFEPEENRKERESIASDVRRELETEAKLKALGCEGVGAAVSVNMFDEEDNNDVVIYLPEIESEKECEVEDEQPEPEAE